MNTSVLECPKCHTVLSLELFSADAKIKCSKCRTKVVAHFFPAALQSLDRPTSPEPVVDEETTSCYHHPEVTAKDVCAKCGIYMCSFCDMEVKGKHLCPNCLEEVLDTDREFYTRTRLYDTLALSLGLIPILFYPVLIVTVPALVVVIVLGWNRVKTPYKRMTVLKMIVALFLALIGFAIIGFFFFAVLTRIGMK